jgi:hypothetical protein
MSSDGDIVAFQNSMNDNLKDATEVLFNDKNYTYITDSTSNSGSFSSGMIQFDLSTLNSQSQWINLSEAVIEFPVKITATLTTAASGGTPTSTIGYINSTIIKNGWHQWIDSCQLIINSQTIQSSQPYENVSASFRILSSWSQDTLRKWGATTGFSIDDMTGDTSSTSNQAGNLSNSLYSTMATSTKGFDVIGNQATVVNKGIVARSNFTNNNIISTTTQGAILGVSAMKQAGRSNVSGATSNTANASIYSAFYMATVRLKDICDINDFPLVKNLKGFLYLGFNSSQVNLTSSTTGSLSAVSVQPVTGRSTPFLVNINSVAPPVASDGIAFGTGTTNGPVIQVFGTVDATTTNAVGSSGPLLTNARLLCPYYLANPKADQALTQSNKFFTTMEKIVNPLTVTAGNTISYTISSGIPNPRKLVILPMLQNLGGSTYLSNPEVSPFDTVPASSGPFAVLNNLQVYLANKPIYQYAIQYDFEQWLMENSQVGLNGCNVNEDTSGLLSQQLFEQNHRFYTVDLSRRYPSEDGSSKSVQVSFTNPTAFGMKCICIVFYEKQWIINTATCQLQTV